MSLSNFFNKKYRMIITELENHNYQLEQKVAEIPNYKATIYSLQDDNLKLKQQVSDLQNFIQSRQPLFDLETLTSFSHIENFQELWAKSWTGIDHTDYRQLIRQDRATKAVLTPLDIDHKSGHAHFHGQKTIYETTLVSCQCIDFQRHIAPCKHIYRLAHELKVLTLSLPVESVPNPHKLLRQGDIDRIKPALSAVSTDILSRLAYYPNIIVKRSDAEQLLRFGLVDIRSNKFDLLNTYKKAELILMLPYDAQGIKSVNKDVLIERIITDYPDVVLKVEKNLVSIEVSPYASHLIGNQ